MCVCASISPGMPVYGDRSMTSAPGGIGTLPLATRCTRSSSTMTTAFVMTRPVPSINLPNLMTFVAAAACDAAARRNRSASRVVTRIVPQRAWCKIPPPSGRLELRLLNRQRHRGIHQSGAAIDCDELTGDESRLLRTEQRHGIPDVRGGAEAAHRRPPVLVMIANHLHDRRGQRVHHAVFDPARAHRIDGDAAR